MNTRLLEDQIHWGQCQISGFWNGFMGLAGRREMWVSVREFGVW